MKLEVVRIAAVTSTRAARAPMPDTYLFCSGVAWARCHAPLSRHTRALAALHPKF